MSEFYVQYDWNSLHYIAIVSGAQQPARLQFADYNELHETMDALGDDWVLTYEMPHPREFTVDEFMVWEKQLAQVMEFIPEDPILGRRKGILE
jgi:hypothetical protein